MKKNNIVEELVKTSKLRNIDDLIDQIYTELRKIHDKVGNLSNFVEGSKMDDINNQLSDLRFRIDDIEHWQSNIRDL